MTASAYLKLRSHCYVLLLQTTPGGKALENLERANGAWRRLCDADQMPFKEVIRETREPLQGIAGLQHYDVIILGGNTCNLDASHDL